MVKVIYACGDSHAAGGETVDDLLWPDEHPGFRDEAGRHLIDPRAIAKWRSFRQRKLNSAEPVSWERWQELEKEQAWPARLQQITGIEVINDALIGSSMEWVARQTIEGVSRLLDAHAPRDVMAIVCPGSWPRIQHRDGRTARWSSMQLANPDGIDSRVHEWFVANEDDESLLTRWLVSITGMSATLSNLGIRLVLLDPAIPDMSKELSLHPGLAHLVRSYEKVCGPLWHAKSMKDVSTVLPFPRCPDLHWRREVHQLIAEDLSRCLPPIRPGA